MILTVGFLKWDGEKWIIDQAFGPQGPTGPQGPPGVGGKTLVGTNINGSFELVALDSTYVTLSSNTSYTFKVTTNAVQTNPSFGAGGNIAKYDMVSAKVSASGIVTINSPLNLGTIIDPSLGESYGFSLNYSGINAVIGLSPTPARLALTATISGRFNYYNVTSYVELVQCTFTPSGIS